MPLLPEASVGAEHACAAVEAALREFLPLTLPADLQAPEHWTQLPAPEVMQSAILPAIAISSPGLLDDAEYDARRGTYSATWEVAASVWLRSERGEYGDTADATRRYVHAMRSAVLAAERAGRTGWRWIDEQYDVAVDTGSARTLGAGAVVFAIPYDVAVDTALLPPATGAADPLLTNYYVTVDRKG